MTKEQFKNDIELNFNNIPNNFFDNIEIYKDFLQKENKIHNLTNLAFDDKIYQEYFFDSLIPFQGIDLKNKKILDIGSGSGIPGILLLLLEITIELTIIESNLKKINFMKDLCNVLELNNVSFFYQRAEEIENEDREYFDIVTSRAVSRLKNLIEISVPYLKIGGILIEPKSLNCDQEQLEAIDIINELKIELLSKKSTINEKTITTLIYKKIFKTSTKYPRTWKEIIAN